MQTDEWMAYSCSLDFSDQFSYIKHFIPSYSLRDMIFARFKHFLKNKREKDGRERTGPDLHDPGPELIRFWFRIGLGRTGGLI
jgi:hypothetical protein